MVEYELVLRRINGYKYSKDPVVGCLYLQLFDYGKAGDIGKCLPMSEFDNECSHFLCHTIEPPIRDTYGCIPEGLFSIKISRSPKFGRMLPEILFVPGRSGIRIHAGNTVKDTHGCILVGNILSESIDTPQLVSSRETLSRVMDIIKKYRIRKIVVFEELPF